MTRAEAIKILKSINPFNAVTVRRGDYEIKQALEMAIASLETDEAYQLEYERTTKNDLGVDAVSRQAVLDLMIQKWGENFSGDSAMQESIDAIRVLPSVTPQEPFKPMVEIDLYSVIKQKYIEREVLDKIRAEIDNALSDGMIHKKTVLGIIDKYKTETEAADE